MRPPGAEGLPGPADRVLEDMDLPEAHLFFRARALEIRCECIHESAWVFLDAAAFIEYLSKAATDGHYASFVHDWLGLVRTEYLTFTYRTGNMQDLPEQMYHILRNGVVHSFSFVPEHPEKGGRERSIELVHRSDGKAHLSSYREGRRDAAVLVAEDLAEDLVQVVEILFEEATTNHELGHKILDRLEKHPPLTSSADPH
jgi:hypothetical protein